MAKLPLAPRWCALTIAFTNRGTVKPEQGGWGWVWEGVNGGARRTIWIRVEVQVVSLSRSSSAQWQIADAAEWRWISHRATEKLRLRPEPPSAREPRGHRPRCGAKKWPSARNWRHVDTFTTVTWWTHLYVRIHVEDVSLWHVNVSCSGMVLLTGNTTLLLLMFVCICMSNITAMIHNYDCNLHGLCIQ